jgi:hypothetical protein
MKKLPLFLTVVGLLVLASSLTASAVVPVTPTVAAVEPSSAFNDIDTRVTITGGDFAAGADGTATISLGGMRLTDVTWVDTQTLTATVPWGMNAGVYDLTVTNPGGGTPGTLTSTFEVKSGINGWNAGELNGAAVRELRMKPGDPNTLYALAYDVGVFRSRDAGDSWTFTSANAIANAVFTVDPNPGHESWLYSAMNDGVYVSKNEGDSWTQLPDPAHDEVIRSAQIFVSPHTSGTLFVGYYGDSTPASILGLRESTDGGSHWASVHRFDGIAVQAIAFDPAPDTHDMVLATSDARVFKSPDEGVTWSQVATPPLPLGIGMTGSITYNPYRTSEVWISSTETSGGMYKSTDANMTAWTDVTPWGHSGYPVTFSGPDDAYIWHAHSTNGGATWEQFGPWPTWGDGEVVFGRSDTGEVDTQTVYVTNSTVGVQKSTDGGASWHDGNQGLTGMRCVSMSVSTTDPLRVYATFDGWGGVYVSDDGTSHWTYVPVADSGQMWQVLQDPFDPGLLYAGGGGFYTSENGAETWHDWGWNGIPDSYKGLMGFGGMAADPFSEGHLLVSARVGQSSTHNHDLGYLFSSDNHGESWTPVVVAGTAGSIGPIGNIVFDPETPGTVYLATAGNGIYRSTDHGDTWVRIDDLSQPSMANAYSISIATHPRHVLLVSGDSGRPFRSFDNGATWENKQNSGEVSARQYVFVDGDSTRLYSPDWTGLHFSGNVGDSWTSAAGALGGVQNTTLAYANADGHTLLYAATTGGKTGVVIASAALLAASKSPMTVAAAPASALVGAGIYRRAQVLTTKTFSSSGARDGWVLESGEHSSKGGKANATAATFRLGDDKSKRQYRSVLSFATSGLPDSAVITKVTLKLRKQGVAGGGDPISKFRGLGLDVKKGFFGSSTALRTGDFQAAASKSYGPFKPALASGWYSIDLTGAKGYLNKVSTHSGLTQVRLRFKLDDNNNRVANYLSLYSGNAGTSVRPRLVVTYYVP